MTNIKEIEKILITHLLIPMVLAEAKKVKKNKHRLVQFDTMSFFQSTLTKPTTAIYHKILA
jgi:hypothetical protein